MSNAGSAWGSASGDNPPCRLEFVQKAFIVKDGCLLLVRKALTDPNHPGRWEVPGGRMLLGEDLDTHIQREVFEETGISIKPDQPFELWQWEMGSGSPGSCGRAHVVAVARRCTPLSDTLDSSHRRYDDHLDEAAWVPLEEINGYDILPDLKPVMATFFKDLDIALK
ncbi:MAG TPA: NUDIX hydrolase [Mycobacteriales bacterium]|nr:NUDIX hydrolase [Mycobacteriales bacterium]